MALHTASEFARLSPAAGWELDRGRLRRPRARSPLQVRRALRLARLLAASVGDAGAWVSTELVVRLSTNPDSAARPDVAVALDEPPADGVVASAPALVALIDDGDPDRWLAAGAGAVWVVRRADVIVSAAGAPTQVADLDARVTVPVIAAAPGVTPALDVPAVCGLSAAVLAPG